MNHSHSKVLTKLVNFSAPTKQLSEELTKLQWDINQPLVVLTTEQVSNVLERYISQLISKKELEDWANLIEGREDIDFEENNEENINQVIYELANPELEEKITTEKVKRLLTRLTV